MASNASTNILHSIIYKKYQEISKSSQNYVISAEGSLAGRQACCLLTHGILQVLTEARRREPDETLPAVETQLSRFTPVTGNSGTEYVLLQPAMTICLMSHGKESIRGDLKVDFMQSLKLWIKIFLKKGLGSDSTLFHLYLIKWTKWPFVWLASYLCYLWVYCI